MPRNYDSSAVGVPYIRVPKIEISYPGPLTASVKVWEIEAVKLADGTIRELRQLGDSLRWDVRPQDMATALQIVHPDTGAAIAGQTITNQGLMLGLLAAIRAQQSSRDAAEDAAPE